MKKPRKATIKDLKKCLRLMKWWGDKRLGGVAWYIIGKLCRCKEHKTDYAHVDYSSRVHIADLSLHQVDDIERTAVHERLHLDMAAMHRLVQELQWDGETQQSREMAYRWYGLYEDEFIGQLTKALLNMDKEIRHWKRKAKKLEKQLCG